LEVGASIAELRLPDSMVSLCYVQDAWKILSDYFQKKLKTLHGPPIKKATLPESK
jgi:hypothetical protein